MTKRTTARKKVGNLGEDIACRFLKGRGFVVLERNYSKKWGEIDIIAEREGRVHFVEVKSVTREPRGRDGDISRERDYVPEELVDLRKLRKLARTAMLYMENMKDEREYQIDVVGVILDNRTRTAKCRYFGQALEDNL
ncbi:MAG: YraN family protein [Patescibacteria group bacterium]|nr:YraN family protein [Patescibacteria group bacterium]